MSQLPNANLTFACTALRITDKKGNVYQGRTLEFPESPLKTSLTYFPKGHTFQHLAEDNKTLGLKYQAKYPILALTMPQNQTELYDCLDGMNAAGLAFSLNMYHHKGLKALDSSLYSEAIPYEAVGEWALANFATIDELKEGLKTAHIWSGIIAVLGLNSPFHFIFYDKTNQCIVVEIQDGALAVYDNPIGVMTNGPEFPWHLTNLNNYTQLTNLDVPAAEVGGLQLVQPDSGIATHNIPSSNTSVGRFVKAFYYSSFANQVDSPDEQIVELSHIMNNFDRPKNINLVKTVMAGQPVTVREYTVWTTLKDLSRGYMYLRDYTKLNYTQYDFKQFESHTELYSEQIG